MSRLPKITPAGPKFRCHGGLPHQLYWSLILATVSISSVVREILSKDPELKADEVVKRAITLGIKAPPPSIKHVVNNLRKEFRPPGKTTPTKPAVARKTTLPAKQSLSPTKSISVSSPAPSVLIPVTTSASPDLAGVFANVTRVNQVLLLCGGVENARQLAEAVQTCGGIDPFLQHLDLVAGIRQTEKTV